MTCVHVDNKALISRLRAAMYDFDATRVRKVLNTLVAPDAVLHMPHPLGDMVGPQAFYETCFAPLLTALPDLERRDWIVMGGQSGQTDNWIGCAGHYMGTFVTPCLLYTSPSPRDS